MKNKLLKKIVAGILILVCINVNKANAQWVATGPSGGFVKLLSHAHDTLFAVGGYNNWEDLYTSTNNGVTWSPITSDTWIKSSNGAKFDLQKYGNSIFVGTLYGIYRSDDNGLTWVNKTTSAGYCFGKKGSTLFAGTDYGVLRSTDNGENWTFLELPGLLFEVPRSIVTTETDVYVGVDQGAGIYRSIDNGDNWTGLIGNITGQAMCLIGDNLFIGTDYEGIQKFNLTTGIKTQVYPYNATYWYFSSIIGDENAIFAGNLSGVLRSTDGGSTWADVSGNGIDVFYNGWSGDVLTQTNGGVYVGTPGGIYRTQNSGEAWSKSDQGIYAQQITYPAIAIHGSDLYTASTFGGIFRSTDEGQDWTDVSAGLDLNTWGYYYGDHMVGADNLGVYAGAYMTTDNGATWVPHNSPGRAGDVGNVPWIESNGVLITSNYDNGVFRSLDNGTTWMHVNTSFGNPNSMVTDGTTLYLNCHAANAGSPSVYYSNDNGATWNPSTFPGASLPPAIGQFVYTGTSMLCATGATGLNYNNGIYRSTDHGITWNKVIPNCSGGGFAISDTNIYVANRTTLQNGDGVWTIYHSTDDGLTWNQVYQNVGLLSGDIVLQSIAAQGTKVFIAKWTGTEETIMYSPDAGVTWQDITMGGPGDYAANAVLDMEILNGKLYAGTAGGSMWFRSLSDFEVPAVPSAISGATTPCIGSTQTYSVTNVPGVAYTWQFPAGWVITGGATTNSVTVTVGNIPGVILVTPTSVGGTGPAQFLVVTPTSAAPGQPSAINGLSNPTQGSSQTYSVINVPGVTYAWSFPSGWVQTAGGNTNSVTVTVGSGNGDIIVTPSTPCGTGTAQTLAITVGAETKTLNLVVFLQGLYAGNGTMNQAQDQNGAHWPTGVADHISVELHDAANYGTIVYTATEVPLSTTGTASVSIPSTYFGTYYITIRHRNSLQTVSAVAQSFAGSTISQSFATPANVYGGNLVQMADLSYAIFGGDVNQDDIIDLGDSAPVDNKAALASSGYLPEDVNGDGLVDLSDASIIDNNAAMAIGVAIP